MINADAAARMALNQEFPGLMTALSFELGYELNPEADLAFARAVRDGLVTSAGGLPGRRVAIFQMVYPTKIP